jgi:cell division septal protein FtsQ
MFFGHKSCNRRLGREYVLDVKLRSSQVRAARTRRAGVIIGLFLALVFGAYLLWRLGDWALARLVYENDAFAIAELDIQTDGVIASEQLRQWAGVKKGDNLLALDLARVKRNLDEVPFIQTVSIERVLPRSLRIRVCEREPLAQITVPRQRPGERDGQISFQLDGDGCVMLPLEPRQRAIPLNPAAEQMPLITGLKTNGDVRPGRFIETPQARAALQLIQSFEHSQMAAFVDVRRIDASAAEALVVTTGQGSEITFGLADLDQQLRRWHEIYDAGQKWGKAISALDLAVSNNIPARWIEASAVPPTPPKLPKLLKKKKHV